MKKVSDVFKSIRFAKGEKRGKPHSSTDDEEHYTVGEKEYEDQIKHAKKRSMQEENLDELSNDLLTRYKKSASDQASAADKSGDFKKGDKRFSGIIKATKKQFANDLKKEESEQVDEDLRKWFDKDHPEGGWKRINSKGEAIGPCAREPGEPKPKCMSNEKRASLSKKERASAVRAKRKHDPDAERKGKPINVSNFGKGKLSEDMENLEEKNVPTSPEKWAQAKAQAKAKFDVYPSAYANGWASKKYKEMGGGWKSVNEEKDEREYGYEGDMAISQLKTIVRHAEHMMGMLKEDTDLPEWVQSKITLATDYMQTAHDYMMGELEEEVEQVDEGVYSQQDIEDQENAANPGMRSPKKKKPDVPFSGPYKKTQTVVPGKHGEGYSTAKKLARDAMKRQASKYQKEEKEMSNKAKLVKDIKNKNNVDKFEPNPILSKMNDKT